MKINILLYGIILTLILSSCVIYHPQLTDIPLISNKNDIRIDAGVSVLTTANATVSYGLTDKIAIQTTGSYGADERYYFQAASGYYKNFNTNKVLELYGGFGYGHGNAFKDNHPGHLTGNYQVYFIQADIGKLAVKKPEIDLGLALKTGFLHSNLTDNNYYFPLISTEYSRMYHDNSLLLEPTGMIRIGGPKLKFSLRLGGCFIHKFTNPETRLPCHKLNFGLGLNYRF